MSRIADTFARLRDDKRTALVPFVTAGDPGPDTTVPLMHAMVEAGADIIELGVPFSDPMADGPVIQRAHERALVHHVSLHDVLDMVRRFREDDPTTPVVLMGYLNPVEAWGYEFFARAAVDAGVDGLLVVDLPPEEAADVVPMFREVGLDPIFLIAPTSSTERMDRIARVASGFVYYVSIKGVTGAAGPDMGELGQRLASLREHIDLPLGVGFGIKNAEAAAAVGRVADAVIVGSALVERIEALQDEPARIAPAVAEVLAAMRAAMDAPGQ